MKGTEPEKSCSSDNDPEWIEIEHIEPKDAEEESKKYDGEILAISTNIANDRYSFNEQHETSACIQISAFGNCLGGVLLLAQNISITIQTNGSVQIAKICTKNKVEVIKEGKHHSTVIGDIFAGENKNIVLKLSLQPVETPCVERIACRLEYSDVLSEAKKSVQTELEVVRSDTDEGVVFNLQVVNATNQIITESIDEAMKVAKEELIRLQALIQDCNRPIFTSIETIA